MSPLPGRVAALPAFPAWFLLAAALLLLAACSPERDEAGPSSPRSRAASQAREPAAPRRCADCHEAMEPDGPHALGCARCHRGASPARDQEAAHADLVAHPAHPGRMAATCGPCHRAQVEALAQAPHLGLARMVNLVRQRFGAKERLDSLVEVPEPGAMPPDTPLGLADDMLRRRCLRCHLYAPGDPYPLVRHGTGCAACHLAYADGKPEDHRFLARPTDRQCLSCHYANHVGADYHGLFEQDYNWEYRTPYVTRERFVRPYGVENYPLRPDAHQRAGMACIDCHSGAQLMAGEPGPTCAGCHDPAATPPDLPGLERGPQGLVLVPRHGEKALAVPPMRHPAHQEFAGRADCAACHAQWSFNDQATHLLLTLDDDLDPWEKLVVQSCASIERLVEHNLYSDEDELPIAMPDGISGRTRPGIWLKGYGQRRWFPPLVRQDERGVFRVFRPVLDLRLSARDEDGEALFDNLQGRGPGLRPYTPHTIGPAGPFFRQRLAGRGRETGGRGRETGGRGRETGGRGRETGGAAPAPDSVPARPPAIPQPPAQP